jgi:phosphoribosylamine--glycine ligase
MKVLLVGGGGREHAIAWKLKQSKELRKLYIAPGNPGTAQCGENVPIKSEDVEGLVKFAKEKKVELVIVGPEDPLAEGSDTRIYCLACP